MELEILKKDYISKIEGYRSILYKRILWIIRSIVKTDKIFIYRILVAYSSL